MTFERLIHHSDILCIGIVIIFILFYTARVKLVSCTVTQFLVVLLMVGGANGDHGQSVQPSVGVESNCGFVSVITPPLREVGESAVVVLTSKRSVTVMPAQVCKLPLITGTFHCVQPISDE